MSDTEFREAVMCLLFGDSHSPKGNTQSEMNYDAYRKLFSKVRKFRLIWKIFMLK